MKLNLRPGVSPAQFWTTVGVGLGGTTATALALTAYSWAPFVIALIGVLVPFFQLQFRAPQPPAEIAQDKAPDGGGDQRFPNS